MIKKTLSLASLASAVVLLAGCDDSVTIKSINMTESSPAAGTYSFTLDTTGIEKFVAAPGTEAKPATPVTWGISGTTTVTEGGKKVTKNVTQICDATIYTATGGTSNQAKGDDVTWKVDTYQLSAAPKPFVQIKNCSHEISGTIYGYFTISEGKNKYTNYQAQIPYTFAPVTP